MYITLLSFRIVTLFFLLPEYIYICIYLCCYCCTWTTRSSYVITAVTTFFYARLYVIKRPGLVMVLGKKRKTSFFFFRSDLIDAIFDDDVLSLSLSLVLLSVRFYLLAKCILDELWFDKERRRTRQDNCVHYWNKWSCFTTSEQNDGRERRTRDEWGNHFFLLLLLASHKK